jgi:hypothetical protein
VRDGCQIWDKCMLILFCEVDSLHFMAEHLGRLCWFNDISRKVLVINSYIQKSWRQRQRQLLV